MASGIFFVSWELWQQMTFVLAMGIVAVFCAGLVKLWWSNRLMKKQEILDEEKRARTQEMRKSGLPIKRPSDIPFGVRAIQSGVEVDGIWISRSTSPMTPKPLSSASLSSHDTDIRKGQGSPINEKVDSVTITTIGLEPETPRHNPLDATFHQRRADADSIDSVCSGPPPVSRHTPSEKRFASHGARVLNEDALRHLEGQALPKPHYHTYMPTSAPYDARQPSQRSSASSSGESVDSQPRSARSGSGRSYASSRSSRLYMARPRNDGRHGYSAVPQGTGSERDARDPFATPARTSSGFSGLLHSDTQRSPAPSQELPAPEPTFSPGDLHLNRSSRRVNEGFEVLPAGTFGPPAGIDHVGDSRQDGRVPRYKNKRKSGQ